MLDTNSIFLLLNLNMATLITSRILIPNFFFQFYCSFIISINYVEQNFNLGHSFPGLHAAFYGAYERHNTFPVPNAFKKQQFRLIVIIDHVIMAL